MRKQFIAFSCPQTIIWFAQSRELNGAEGLHDFGLHDFWWITTERAVPPPPPLTLIARPLRAVVRLRSCAPGPNLRLVCDGDGGAALHCLHCQPGCSRRGDLRSLIPHCLRAGKPAPKAALRDLAQGGAHVDKVPVLSHLWVLDSVGTGKVAPTGKYAVVRG